VNESNDITYGHALRLYPHVNAYAAKQVGVRLGTGRLTAIRQRPSLLCIFVYRPPPSLVPRSVVRTVEAERGERRRGEPGARVSATRPAAVFRSPTPPSPALAVSPRPTTLLALRYPAPPIPSRLSGSPSPEEQTPSTAPAGREDHPPTDLPDSPRRRRGADHGETQGKPSKSDTQGDTDWSPSHSRTSIGASGRYIGEYAQAAPRRIPRFHDQSRCQGCIHDPRHPPGD
jgi:hypothetical protein